MKQTENIAHTQTQKACLHYLKGAQKKMSLMIEELSELQDPDMFNDEVSINLPGIINSIAIATKQLNFESPGQMAMQMLPVYWKEALDFPLEKHSLEEVWKSMWKCNLDPNEVKILKNLHLPEEYQDIINLEKNKTAGNKNKKKLIVVKKEKVNIQENKPELIDSDKEDEIEYYEDLLTMPTILDNVYSNLEKGKKFSLSLPGFTSDQYTQMDREKLEEYLNKFDLEQYNQQIIDTNVVYKNLDTVTQKNEEYAQILKKAYWQGPFFYGGSNPESYGYISFATITKEGKFGGWWLVMWKNGTLKLTQNIGVDLVGSSLITTK